MQPLKLTFLIFMVCQMGSAQVVRPLSIGRNQEALNRGDSEALKRKINIEAFTNQYFNKLKAIFTATAKKSGNSQSEIIEMLRSVDYNSNNNSRSIRTWDDYLLDMAMYAELMAGSRFPTDQSKRENYSDVWKSGVIQIKTEMNLFYPKLKQLYDEDMRIRNTPFIDNLTKQKLSTLLSQMKEVALNRKFDVLLLITPTDVTNLYENTKQMYYHAGVRGISFTQDEIQSFGLTQLVNLGYIAPGITFKDHPKYSRYEHNQSEFKIDSLPKKYFESYNKSNQINPDYSMLSGQILRSVFNAGIYRVLKGVPIEMWSKFVVEEYNSESNNKMTRIGIAYNGNIVLNVNMVTKEDGNWGIVDVYISKPTIELERLLHTGNQK